MAAAFGSVAASLVPSRSGVGRVQRLSVGGSRIAQGVPGLTPVETPYPRIWAEKRPTNTWYAIRLHVAKALLATRRRDTRPHAHSRRPQGSSNPTSRSR